MTHTTRVSGAAGAAVRWLAAAAACGLLALTAAPAWAKSYDFERVSIEAVVTADGHLRIVEARTYRFDGSFSWATYELPLAGTSGIRDVSVADDRGPYRLSTSGEPGTYRVSRGGGGVEIRWHFRAESETRTFTFRYHLDDVVAVYDDVAELYWKFIGTGWDVPTRTAVVNVRLPGRVPADQIRVWGHGPLHGHATPVEGGARLEIERLPASTMLEGRVVFPRSVVPGARVVRGGQGLPRILAEEQRWARAANLRRVAARLVIYASAVLPVIVLGVWVWLYGRYGREYRPADAGDYYRELPGTYSPAELGVLWRFGAVAPADFVATILDLARRGFIAIDRRHGRWGRETYTLARTGKGGVLQPFEREALELLFGKTDGPGQPITIERGGLPADVQRRIGRSFSAWKSKVQAAAHYHGFFDPASARVSGWSLGIGILLLVAAWFGGFTSGFVAGLGIFPAVSLVACGLVLLAGSGALRRRSRRGADDLGRWQAFRRFLLHFSEMPRADLPSLAIWEHYLVYAVPLGVADQVIRQLGKLYSPEELAQAPSLRVWSSGAASRGGAPLASLATFTTALAAATSSATSGRGSGGGFSGGGGGGGGGSGGRAG
ncbi:MAG: DUF2207 domain-containing protein [Armatimonadota bacterium]|nr:DUF2207 domain-containing protein [Armatimonadota bacterium]MDR7496467.1 DUF2207 domain-containing protein [Armatimonadota bacterium]